LSGGQQQRTALARALVKGAELVLLDEPLANLDYKLREELRIELPRIFAEAGAIFVYATTEPQEALLLGGRTVTLREGSVTQFGKTIDVYNNPTNLETAQTFSDPPMNVIPMQKRGVDFTFSDGQVSCPKDLLGLPDGAYNIGIRPHHLMLNQSEATTLKIQAPVSSTEISGSETFIHVSQDDLKLVVLTHGVHRVGIGDHIDIYLDPSKFFIFDQHDALVSAPNVGIA
jgi:glycerol transport system ATP-binding protein